MEKGFQLSVISFQLSLTMSKLSHYDETGEIKMVDVSEKAVTKRRAVASARVLMNAETIEAIRNQTNPKGNPLEIARIAGIMAAKQTANLIPLCHQLPSVKNRRAKPKSAMTACISKPKP